ncbi:hypothetical protein [Pseudomonas sp. CHM02]|uniref:hypothetical protein n=1 Tax=Pseudomonas sp. CHM02 TaxID=1463662 RepID=UPI0012DE0504|nr:hypothetical protein [Pseudomonas sp. CHM02]
MNIIKSIHMALGLLIATSVNLSNANDLVTDTSTSHVLTIVFTPPKGMEREFFENFVQNQSKYMRIYSGKQKQNTQVINIAPTTLGEPLIHLIIYNNKASFDNAKDIFRSTEVFANYMQKHSSRFGNYEISKPYLENSNVYFGEVIKN